MSIVGWYGLAFAARTALIVYGAWQDLHMAVKFTDVDYHVFSDAAQFVSQGKSPYLQATYRYTPVLSWALILNVWLSPLVGKLIFITFDILVGHTIYRTIRGLGHSHQTARNCVFIWLLNPLPATVSSRGNAESVVVYLVLKTLSCLQQGKIASSAMFYAMAIHFKIYPIIYALPIYLYLGEMKGNNQRRTESKISRQRGWGVQAALSALMPNKDRVVFVTVCGLILVTLTGFFYWKYGWIFLYETYFYHIVRGDIRHNFSPYFYLLYLTSDSVTGVPLILRLMIFLPQMVLVVALAVQFYRDQPFCWFLCTFVFVMANKVCTSQYFLWYLSLLPLILPLLKMTITRSAFLLFMWFAAQGIWLFPAYLLEFKGYNTFLAIWAAGLLFFCINAVILQQVIGNYKVKLK